MAFRGLLSVEGAYVCAPQHPILDRHIAELHLTRGMSLMRPVPGIGAGALRFLVPGQSGGLPGWAAGAAPGPVHAKYSAPASLHASLGSSGMRINPRIRTSSRGHTSRNMCPTPPHYWAPHCTARCALRTRQARPLQAERGVSVELHPETSLRLGGVDTPSLQGGPDETTGSGITTSPNQDLSGCRASEMGRGGFEPPTYGL
jgi:hypothetical protein